MTEKIHSMTGFARAEAEGEFGALCWELRSVNHRYLDVQFKLPETLRAAETRFKARATERLARGKVDCTLTVQSAADAEARLLLDLNVLRGLRDAIRTTEGVFTALSPTDPLELLRWPGVLQQAELDAAGLTQAALEQLDVALTALLDMRRREGEHLADTLRQRCDDIAALAATIAERRPEVIAGIDKRLREKLERLALATDSERIETELVLIAQKLDVDEELDRLDGHLTQVRRILERGGPCGRKLDFLIQELNREANTICSKAADSVTTSAGVDIKVAIEQMREQVQNIE